MSQQGQYPSQNNYPPRQPGGYPQPPPPPGGPYPYQGAPYTPRPVKKPANPLLYLIPLIGVIIMAVGVFLPWFNMTLLGGTIGVNGLGNLSGPSDLVNTLTQSTGNGAKDGVLVLGLAVILVILIALGLLIKARGFAIAAIVFGVFSLGLAIFEVSDISKSINSINATGAGQVTAQTGLGVYIVLVGSIIVLLGAIATVALFRRTRARV